MGTLLDATVLIQLERAQAAGESRIAGVVGWHAARREAFVEAVLEAYPAIPFDLRCARVHARVWADLVAAGRDTGAHDRVIASTALAHGWRLATPNVRHFRNVHGLDLVELDLSS